MKEEPDFYAPFEPEVIVNYPQDGMDDDDDQVREDGRVGHALLMMMSLFGFVKWPPLHFLLLNVLS